MSDLYEKCHKRDPNVTPKCHKRDQTKYCIKEIPTIEFHTMYIKLLYVDHHLCIPAVYSSIQNFITHQRIFTFHILVQDPISCEVTNVTNRYMDFIRDLGEDSLKSEIFNFLVTNMTLEWANIAHCERKFQEWQCNASIDFDGGYHILLNNNVQTVALGLTTGKIENKYSSHATAMKFIR